MSWSVASTVLPVPVVVSCELMCILGVRPQTHYRELQTTDKYIDFLEVRAERPKVLFNNKTQQYVMWCVDRALPFFVCAGVLPF